ncbi:hypothetical protein JTE90_001364 [Oedothorax gibbosus]|uniref:Uncharacterized protein n=1 Tax=Oedothorax gibbosus TaxID=931172 RepID=A0AAV6VFF6_9ARAC|nr:hypothetical protein JTE90_001364 [Oedothorax gibbosus]
MIIRNFDPESLAGIPIGFGWCVTIDCCWLEVEVTLTRSMTMLRPSTILTVALFFTWCSTQTSAHHHHHHKGHHNNKFGTLLTAGVLAKVLEKKHGGHHHHPQPMFIPVPVPVQGHHGSHHGGHHGRSNVLMHEPQSNAMPFMGPMAGGGPMMMMMPQGGPMMPQAGPMMMPQQGMMMMMPQPFQQAMPYMMPQHGMQRGSSGTQTIQLGQPMSFGGNSGDPVIEIRLKNVN